VQDEDIDTALMLAGADGYDFPPTMESTGSFEGFEDNPERMRLAQSLNDRAEEYMQTHDTDYTTALREVVRLSDKGDSEPSVAEVERYMKKHDVTDFGQAARQVATEYATTQDSGSVHIDPGVDVEQENAGLEEVLKERGYDV
jgi:hypothetical protein